ncbi:MAG TPA: response regulator [Candidatus Competibacteraceae bacterium]|nr:response regulator [Candidatus Competibacteraceae bacterium]
MSHASRLLVVDDEADIGKLIRSYFSQQGYMVDAVLDGEAMRRFLAQHPVDLVLLDLGLPGEDGLSLARYLREHHALGIIILTGRGKTVDRIVGLEVGADDYVVKPFDLRELLARVRSVLRRLHAVPANATHAAPPALSFAGWRVHLGSRQVLAADGRPVTLTSGEFDLLSIFLHNPQRVLSRDHLMTLIHHRQATPFDRSIDVQISRLRHKLEADPNQPQLIKTVRGVGYLFAAPVERIPT